jgi:deubiquitinase DESI2
MMGYRFRQIIRDLSEEYTCGKYHMFNLNCNHFTNALAERILGSGIPTWVLRTTDILGWICCCLPRSITSGQWALESLLEEDRRREEAEKHLTTQF